MRGLQAMTARYGLLVMVLALIIAGGATGVAATRAATDRAVTIRESDRTALHSAMVGLTGGYVNTMVGSLRDQTLTREFELSPGSAQDRAELRQIVAGSVFFREGATLTDLRGEVLTTWSPAGPLPPLGDPGYDSVMSGLMSGEPGVSGLLTAGERLLVAVALPVPATGPPQGLVIGYVSVGWADLSEQFFGDLPLGERTLLVVTDSRGVVVVANREELLGRPSPAVDAHSRAAAGQSGLLTDESREEPSVSVFAPIDAPGGWSVTVDEPVADFLGPIRSAGTQVQLVVLVLLVVAAVVVSLLHHRRQAALQQLADQALHDPLTGLPNRILFNSRLDAMLSGSRPTGGAALLFCDLDGFKQINDGYGHSAGDQLLVTVGQRLRSCVRDGDLVARIGGDEFTVLLDAGPDGAAAVDVRARQVADRIATVLSVPVDLGLDRPPVPVGVSIGISVLGADQDPGDTDLLRLADDAMYRAKARGGGSELVTVGA